MIYCKDCSYWFGETHDLCRIPNPGISPCHPQVGITDKVIPAFVNAVGMEFMETKDNEKVRFVLSRQKTITFGIFGGEKYSNILGKPSQLNFDNECILHSSIRPLKLEEKPVSLTWLQRFKIKLMLRKAGKIR